MSRAHGRAGATMVKDDRVDNCSCDIDTSAIHGGRMDAQERRCPGMNRPFTDILSFTALVRPVHRMPREARLQG
ncbi:MAG: hypothetical protein OQL16_06955 [Gammaproteobacteria bacterium]|nr:hypothetical protein [Gammaproteobacteria bacterium]